MIKETVNDSSLGARRLGRVAQEFALQTPDYNRFEQKALADALNSVIDLSVARRDGASRGELFDLKTARGNAITVFENRLGDPA